VRLPEHRFSPPFTHVTLVKPDMMLHKDTDQAQEVMALLNQLPLSLHTLEAKEGVAVVAFPQLDLPDHLDLMDNQVTMELLAIQEKKDLPELLLPLNVNSTQVAKNADKHKLAHQESQDQRDCREKLANQGRLRTADYEDLQDHQDQLGQPDTQEIQDSPVNQESQEQSAPSQEKLARQDQPEHQDHVDHQELLEEAANQASQAVKAHQGMLDHQEATENLEAADSQVHKEIKALEVNVITVLHRERVRYFLIIYFCFIIRVGKTGPVPNSVNNCFLNISG